MTCTKSQKHFAKSPSSRDQMRPSSVRGTGHRFPRLWAWREAAGRCRWRLPVPAHCFSSLGCRPARPRRHLNVSSASHEVEGGPPESQFWTWGGAHWKWSLWTGQTHSAVYLHCDEGTGMRLQVFPETEVAACRSSTLSANTLSTMLLGG